MDDEVYETRFLSRKQVRICEVISNLTWKGICLVCEQTITTTKLISISLPSFLGPPVIPAYFLSYPIPRNQELVIDFFFFATKVYFLEFLSGFADPSLILFELYLCEVTNSSLLSNVPFYRHTAAF